MRCKMSNFCSAFENRGWSRKPSGGIQRRFEPTGRHSKRPPLSSLNPNTRPGTHSHQTEEEGRRDGRRDTVGRWGRQQSNRSSTEFNGGFGAERRNLGDGTSQPALAQVSPLRTAIKDLYPHQPNTAIVGIVVGKFSIHSFPDKRNPGNDRYKFTFTLRDSPADYINATCWGSQEYIKRLHSSFKICDVVDLQNGQVLSKTSSDLDDKWKPWTPSQYQINVSENYSSLSVYDGLDYTEFSALAHIPLRPPNDYYTLSEVLNNGQSLDGSSVNILAIIKHVGAPKQMTSRHGKPLSKCEVRLMDDGCPNFSLLIWDEELIELAQTWTPKENIIFAIDVRVSFDSYRNCMVATCNQKSIITTNPDCHEAHQLYQYGQTVDLGSAAHSQEDFTSTNYSQDNFSPSMAALCFNSLDVHTAVQFSWSVHSISQVLTVERLLEHQSSGSVNQSMSEGPHNGTFSCILFVFLTSLEIDDSPSMAVCYRCDSCHFKVDKEATQCSNKNCTGLNFSSELHFNLMISLSDHTGGLSGVRLQGKPAIDILKCTPQEFIAKSERERTELKSSLLLEKFKIFVRSSVQTQESRAPPLRVLHMSLANPEEALST